jgi:hypothetical protein
VLSNLVEHGFRRKRCALGHIGAALPDRFLHVGACGDVEQPLVRFRILNDGSRPALDGQNHRPPMQGATHLRYLPLGPD